MAARAEGTSMANSQRIMAVPGTLAKKNQIGVSDRANSRIEYYEVDPKSPDKFEYKSTTDLRPTMGAGALPCNIRVYPDQDHRAIVPDLSGPVEVLDKDNKE